MIEKHKTAVVAPAVLKEDPPVSKHEESVMSPPHVLGTLLNSL